MDHIELWDKAKALMREELANVSYTTWIEQPLKPVYVVDDKLALEVISDFNEKTIRALPVHDYRGGEPGRRARNDHRADERQGAD